MRRSPCYGCPDRALGCHASCERYAAYREQQERVYQARRDVAQVGFYISEQMTKRERQRRERRWRQQP